MVRIPRGNPTLIVLFLAGIVLPSLILSFLSFRSIRNEVYLAEKAYEEELTSFQKAAQQRTDRQFSQLISQVRKQSSYLFDQPQTLEEMSKTPPPHFIEGIQAIFLFKGDHPVFPPRLPLPQTENIVSTWRPHHLSPANPIHLLKQVRQAFQDKNYPKCILLTDLLLQQDIQQGILHSEIHHSLLLLRFKSLLLSNHLAEARHMAMQLAQDYAQNPRVTDLSGTIFLFSEMFNAILSFEGLSASEREQLWNIKENLTFQLQISQTWIQYQTLLKQLTTAPKQDNEGLSFAESQRQWGFRMQYPQLPENQIIYGIFDKNEIQEILLNPIRSAAREWKQVYFQIFNNQGKVLIQRIPKDTLILISETPISTSFQSWSLKLYQRDMKEIQQESRKKMLLLYSLVAFSLLILILGSFFIAQGISQERQLLSMKTNFLSSVSHELKTPLTSIRMFSEMMAQGRVKKPEKIAEYSTLIGKEANRLESLIHAILNYTRMERGNQVFRWDRINLSHLTEKICLNIATIAQEKGLAYHLDLEPELYVMGDETSLHSMIQNLVDNAVKYTPAPGEIWVSLQEEEGILFQVRDTGIGIASSEQRRIFDDFYRVGDEMTRSTKGSGLGLAIVRKAAESHRASITLQSKPEKGSTFSIRFRKASNDS